jgi:hypothetical protein
MIVIKMSRTSAGRSVNLLYDLPTTVSIEYGECDITTRFNAVRVFKESPFSNLTWYAGTTINDIFQSKLLLFAEIGLYDMQIECETNGMSGNMVFYLDNFIIGAVDFYSKFQNFTIKYIEGIQITLPRKYVLTGKVDTKNPSSLGYNIVMGNIKIIKRV